MVLYKCVCLALIMCFTGKYAAEVCPEPEGRAEKNCSTGATGNTLCLYVTQIVPINRSLCFVIEWLDLLKQIYNH